MTSSDFEVFPLASESLLSKRNETELRNSCNNNNYCYYYVITIGRAIFAELLNRSERILGVHRPLNL